MGVRRVRPSGLASVVASAVVLAGCGHVHNFHAAVGRPIATRPPPREASAPAGRPGGPVNRGRASAFARAVNLTLADIPGASVGSIGQPPKGHDEARACGADLRGGALSEARSQRFVRGRGLARESIESAVAVLKSPAAASSALPPVHSATWRACYARVLARRLGSEGAGRLRASGVSVSVLAAQAPHTLGSFGLRISARLSYRQSGATIRLYIDVLGFVSGQAQVSLDATSFIQPEPAKTERELLTLMSERAASSPL